MRSAASHRRPPRAPAAPALPNLIVIGAQKCGTSALHYYLDLHPAVSMSRPKELHFFLSDEPVREGPFWTVEPDHFERIVHAERNRARGIDWYAGHFHARAQVRGESSPSYTAPWYPQTAAMIAQVVPDARLVFMVRDPLERAVSQYLHLRADGRERRELDEALSNPRGYYLARSRYHAVLEPFLERFPASRILVVSQEELLLRRRDTMRTVYRFAGIDESFWSPRHSRERNRSEAKGGRYGFVRRVERGRLGRLAYLLPEEVKWLVERLVSPSRRPAGASSPSLDPGLRNELSAYLRDDVARLRKLTEREFAEWSI